MELDPRQILAALFRHRRLLVIVPCVTLLIGAVITVLTPREYQAVATMQIEQRSSKVLSTDDTEPQAAAAQDSDLFLQTQLGLLNSKALAAQVVDSLGLAKDNRALVRLGMSPEAVTGFSGASARRDALVAMLRTGLTVTLPRDSRIAQIAFKGRDPELCARIANSYVKNFIYYNLQRRFQESSYALNFLRDQLDRAKQRLEDSERATVAYATRSRLIDTNPNSATIGAGSGELRTPTTANMSDLNTALSSAEAAKIEAEQRWDEAQKTPLTSIPEVLQSSAIQSLIEHRAVLEAEYQQDRQRRKPDFPTMQQAAAQITELNQQIDQIAESIRSSLHNRYDVAVQNEQALASQLDKLKSSTLSEQGLSIEYNILRREVDTNRTMYDGLLQRYKEVSAAAGVTANNITGVDTAEVPTNPVTPKLKMNLASAGIAGLILALLMVLLSEKFNDVIHSADEVRMKIALPLLGSLPRIPSGSTSVRELANPRSPFSEASISSRAFLEGSSPGGLCKSLLVTSCQQTESAASYANALAHDFARTGRRVLLVDADLRSPSLHILLNRDASPGLSEILAGEISVEEGIVSGVDTDLDFLPAGSNLSNPAVLLSSPRFPTTLVKLHQRYDIVVFTAPPALQLADALLIAAFAEATIMVLDANTSKTELARASLTRLREVGARISGIVLAGTPAPRNKTIPGARRARLSLGHRGSLPMQPFNRRKSG